MPDKPPEMKEYEVKSEQIRKIGYCLESRIMRITFIGGGGGAVYDYFDVPPELPAILMFSRSVGSTFHNLVKKGRWADPSTYKKVVRTVEG